MKNWGVLKGKQLPQKQWVCLLRTGLWGRSSPKQAPGADSGIPHWGGPAPERAELSLACPSPWAELGGPAAARPPLSTHVVYRCLKESWALLSLIPRPCLKQPRQPHHNTFKIAVRCQPLCRKKHLCLGEKASKDPPASTCGCSWLGMVLPSYSGKGTGFRWPLVQLDPAVSLHLKSSFPGKDTAFLKSFFLSPGFVRNHVLHSLLSWHLPSKIRHWGTDLFFFK